VDRVHLMERNVVEELPRAEDVDLVRSYCSDVVERQAEIDDHQGFRALVHYSTTTASGKQLRAIATPVGAPHRRPNTIARYEVATAAASL
jgi:hypothetical protein